MLGLRLLQSTVRSAQCADAAAVWTLNSLLTGVSESKMQWRSIQTASENTNHAVISLGGNIGDTVKFLQYGTAAMAAHGIQVMRTSHLYATEPMHVLDQPTFMNAAALVTTALDPLDLLASLKKIEGEAGRDPGGRRWGPRPLDLDIIFYNDSPFQHEKLTIPHPRWNERNFVKFPVADLLHPSDDPQSLKVQSSLLEVQVALAASSGVGGRSEDVRHIFPLTSTKHHLMGKSTLLMGILNVTPDSFSDGGRFSNVDNAEAHACSLLDGGADIIDVGGQSTRPGAVPVSAEEEASRIVPVIRRLAQMEGCVISVDTFHSKVAQAAVAAGGHIINDVSAGTRDPAMLSMVAKLGVPYIMMHMRGDAMTMQSEENLTYENLLADVGKELQGSVDAAMHAGIELWRIMLDPGIGFSKTQRDNCRLIAGLPKLREVSLSGAAKRAPMLLGSSRKGFLGTLTGHKSAADRDFASVSAVASGVSCGADVVRVHNVAACRDAVRVADGIHRDWWPTTP